MIGTVAAELSARPRTLTVQTNTEMSENSLQMLRGPGTTEAYPKAAAPEPDQRELDAEAWASDHAVNIRLSIPLVFRRFYVTIVAGTERRDRERRGAKTSESERDLPHHSRRGEGHTARE